MSQQKFLTAIIYCSIKQVNGKQFLKYRKIKNDANTISRFAEFARKFPGAEHINFYHKETKAFKERIYLQ